MSGVAGTRNFGKVSVVPNLFYVATKFFHINFVPLIPLGSSVILANSERESRVNGLETRTTFLAKAIPFSWKSFLMAYVRLTLWVASIVSVPVFAFNMLQLLAAKGIVDATPGQFDPDRFAMAGAAALFAPLALYWSYRVAVASEARAIELGNLFGFPEATVRQHLAIEGYPFHRQGPQHVWQCPYCNTINRLIAKEGKGSCVRCGAVKTVARPTPLFDALFVVGMIGVIGFVIWLLSGPSSKPPVIKESAYSTPAAGQPAGLAPSYPSPYGQSPAAGGTQLPPGFSPYYGSVTPPKK